MTRIESLELALCFGATIGWIVASLITMVADIISLIRTRSRRRKERKALEAEAVAKAIEIQSKEE